MAALRLTPAGTVSMIFWRMMAQRRAKTAGSVKELIVALPSTAKTRKSELRPFVFEMPTTSGFVVFPRMNSVATLLLKVDWAWVGSSKRAYSFVAVPTGTIKGFWAECTPPMVCPQAVASIISLLLNPMRANCATKVSVGFSGIGTPKAPAAVASMRPPRTGTTGPPQALTAVYMERASRSAMEARTEKYCCRKMKVVVKAGPLFSLRPVSNISEASRPPMTTPDVTSAVAMSWKPERIHSAALIRPGMFGLLEQGVTRSAKARER
jgi:hypothetical protein